jgi:alpha-D-ribose 1-methylphosphonate 5-triphosphate synthase subunit PhnH
MPRETAYDEVFDAQRHFRVLLDAMARPGEIAVLDGVDINPPGSLHPAGALIGLALFDRDVEFHVDGSRREAEEYLALNTAARPGDAAQADFLFLEGNRPGPALEAARVGDPRYPEEGATAIIQVEKISSLSLPGGWKMALSGPGVDGETTVFIAGLDPAVLEELAEKNAEFPTGVDAMLTAPDGTLLCLPRTTRIRLEKV